MHKADTDWVDWNYCLPTNADGNRQQRIGIHSPVEVQKSQQAQIDPIHKLSTN